MPNNASHKKRLRQSNVRRLRNRQVRSEIRTRTKQMLEMDSHAEAEKALPALYKALDQAARKKVIEPNAASRQKARVARHLNSLA